MARREAVLVERRDFCLDFGVGGKRARALGVELDHFVNHEAHGERHQGLPQDGQKVVEPNFQKHGQRKYGPDIAIAQAHIELEELFRLFRKMAVCPVN